MEDAGRLADGGLPGLAWQEVRPVRAEVPWERWPPELPEAEQAPREAAASRAKRLPWEPEAAAERRGAEPERWPCVGQEA